MIFSSDGRTMGASVWNATAVTGFMAGAFRGSCGDTHRRATPATQMLINHAPWPPRAIAQASAMASRQMRKACDGCLMRVNESCFVDHAPMVVFLSKFVCTWLSVNNVQARKGPCAA